MLCGRRLWLSITTRHIAKSAKREALVSRVGGVEPGLPRPRSPGIPPRISPEAAPLLCARLHLRNLPFRGISSATRFRMR